MNDTDFENILNDDNTLNENVIVNYDENTENETTENENTETGEIVSNETTENTTTDISSVNLDTIHGDLGIITSFLCIFSIIILVKIVLRFFNMFF